MINPNKFVNNLEERYSNFILTTICQNNKDLRAELSDFFKDKKIFDTDSFKEKIHQYKDENLEDKDISWMDYRLKKLLQSTKMRPYTHQSKAWQLANTGKNYIVATGTGSGKTESFLIPILNHCIKQPTKGVQAIIVYPLKALSKNQGNRIGEIIDELNKQNNLNLTYAIFDGDLDKSQKNKQKIGKPAPYNSELQTKEEVINNPPNILLTNYSMLERIITNPKYLKIIDPAKIKFFVLDEIHYYRGAQGIDVSLLIRRFNHQIKNDSIQYIGTSATLGSPNDTQVINFLEKLFNKKFEQNSIIFPEYTTNDKEIEIVKKSELINHSCENARLHSFFSAPNDIYRCFDCEKLKLTDEQCEQCGSRLVFKIMTCRHCGKEYFEFPYRYDEKVKNNSSKIKSIGKFVGLLKTKHIEYSNDTGYLVATKNLDFNEDYSKKVMICPKCGSIQPNESKKCLCGFEEEFKQIYLLDDPEKSIEFNPNKTNNKCCPVCENENTRLGVIAPISKLSDENCSHIIFDESFLQLPEEKRKFLIFTDNVQRTSKFAREIQETHIKNYARLQMKTELVNFKEKKVSEFIFSIKTKIQEELNEDVNVDEIEKELFEEIFKNRNKVASLSKQGLFSLLVDIKNIDEKKIADIQKITGVLMDNCQISDYYKILESNSENRNYNFLNIEQLLTKSFKKIYSTNKNVNKEKNKKEIEYFKELISILYSNNMLIDKDEKPFLKPQFVKIIANQLEVSDNYYQTWGKDTNVPLIKTRTHNAKIDTEKRRDIESEFSSITTNNLLIVATSTLELGIDIGDLDLVGLLYAPPSPAQYTQRIGRAGRGNKKSAMAVTYLAKNALNSWYFNKPQELISGKIEPPPYDVTLEQPIKKSIFGLLLYILLNEQTFQSIVSKDLEYDSWKINKNEIKSYVTEIHNKELCNELDPFVKTFNQDLTTQNIISEWSEKLCQHIDLHNNLEKEGFKDPDKYHDIFTFLRCAELLPDYAFGNAGVVVRAKKSKLSFEKQSITGFQLNQVCPPLYIDFDKKRYKSVGINLDWLKNEIPQSKKCPSCNIVYTDNSTKCTLCNRELNSGNLINEVYYPRIIDANPSGFSNNPLFIDWATNVINLEHFETEKNFMSKPLKIELINYFNGVLGTDKKYYFCSNCGKIIYDGEKSKCKEGESHKKSNWNVGEKIKTIGILIKISNKNIRIQKTLRLTVLNALISAITIESGCEDGEVNGILINEDTILLYDDIQGGVGFVNVLYNKPRKVIQKAIDLCDDKVTNCCKDGCLKCIGSFWRQKDLEYLDKSNPEIKNYFKEILKILLPEI